VHVNAAGQTLVLPIFLVRLEVGALQFVAPRVGECEVGALDFEQDLVLDFDDKLGRA